MNENYELVFTKPDIGPLPFIECRVGEGEKLKNVRYTKEKIIKKIDGLRREAAGGPDGITPRVLKEVSEEIAEALVTLYSR